jgi:PAS domain S-box-containing protein
MRKLAMQIQSNLDFLAEAYARRLQAIREYAEMPDLQRTEAARNALQVIAAGLEAGDAHLFTQFVKTIANERVAQGFEIESVHQALNILIDLLEPGLDDLETANFLWRTMVQVQMSLSQVAMERVRTAEQQFRYLADNLAVGIFIHQNGILRYAGREGARLLGYDNPDDLVGRSVFEFVHPQDRERVMDIARSRISGKPVPDQYEARLVKRDGSVIDAQIFSTLTEYEGELATQGVFVDISERKREEASIRRSRESLQALIDSMPFGVMIAGKDKRIRHANRSALASMGYAAEAEVRGRICHETMCPAEADSCPILDLGYQLDRAERILVAKDGRHIPILKSAVPLTLDGEEVLLEAFVDVTEQKRLERQVQDSLERRGRQVETSTEIAQEIAATPVLSELYQKVVTLVKEQFDYYHVQLFLLDEAGDRLVTVAGYGEVGNQLLQQGHFIPLGKGVVGRAGARGRPILSPDVSLDPEWLYHPLLPETKGELAVPVILRRPQDLGTGPLSEAPERKAGKPRGRVLGVLDVQSDRVGSLTDDDRILLEGLCGQIAIAIESTRLRQETEEYLQELEHITRIMSRQGWETFWDRSGPVGYLFNRSAVVPAVDVWTPEVGQAAAQQSFAPPISDSQPVAVAPLKVRSGELIGVLGVQDDPDNPLSHEDLALVESVSQQLAQALEGARLLDEEQRARTLLGMRVNELDCLNDLGRKIDEAPQIPEFLQWVAERIMPAMQYPELCRVAIELQGTVYGVPEALSLSCQIEQKVHIGSEIAGRICIAYTEERSFLDEESALLDDIARRVGDYIENRRLFDETRLRAQQLEALNEVGRAISSVLDLQTLLREIVDSIKGRFGHYFVGILLVEGNEIVFRDGSTIGDAGVRLEPGGRAMDLEHGTGLVVDVARTGQPILVKDTLNDPRYLPVPEMPDTRSELDIPILVRGRVIGVLDVQSDRPFAYGPDDVTLLQSLANQAGVAIENARLFQQTQQRLQELTMLSEVSRALASAPLRREDIANIVAHQFVQVMGVPEASVSLLEPEGGVLRTLADIYRDPTDKEIHHWGEESYTLGDFPATARVMETLQPLVVQANDPEADPLELAYMREYGTQTLVIIPMAVKGQAIGVVELEAWDEERQFPSDELNLAMTLANQAAVALENAHLLAESQRHAEEQVILNEVARVLAAHQDMDSVLEEAYGGVTRLMGATDFCVVLYDPEACEVTLTMTVVDGQVDWLRTARPVGELGLTQHLITTRQPLLIPEHVQERAEQLGLPFLPLIPGRVSVSWLGVPMLIRDEILGAMVVLSHTTPRAFDEHSQALLTAVANQAALALEKVRLLAGTQAALAEVRATHRSYLRQAWQEHLRQREMLERSGFLYDQLEAARAERAVAIPDLWRPEIERALAAGGPIIVHDGNGDEERAGLAVPITLRGQTLGVIGVEAPEGGRQWTEDEVALVEAIGEQLGQALESARLFADTQRSAERERLVSEISARIRASTDIRAILETAAEELGQMLGTSRALVRLTTGGTEAENGNQPSRLAGPAVEGRDPAHEEQG